MSLRTPHTVPAVVAQIAVAVADGDGTAVVTTGGVELEAGELVAADSGGKSGVVELASGPIQDIGVELLGFDVFRYRVRMAVAIGAIGTVGAIGVAVAVGFRGGTAGRASSGTRRTFADASGLCVTFARASDLRGRLAGV
jgi:hypothetical protein